MVYYDKECHIKYIGGFNMMNIKIEEARKMNKKEVEIKLGMRTKMLEGFGMTHDEACNFVSGIMNLGIAAQELWNKGIR
jgi:hypothetical protein